MLLTYLHQELFSFDPRIFIDNLDPLSPTYIRIKDLLDPKALIPTAWVTFRDMTLKSSSDFKRLLAALKMSINRALVDICNSVANDNMNFNLVPLVRVAVFLTNCAALPDQTPNSIADAQRVNTRVCVVLAAVSVFRYFKAVIVPIIKKFNDGDDTEEVSRLWKSIVGILSSLSTSLVSAIGGGRQDVCIFKHPRFIAILTPDPQLFSLKSFQGSLPKDLQDVARSIMIRSPWWKYSDKKVPHSLEIQTKIDIFGSGLLDFIKELCPATWGKLSFLERFLVGILLAFGTVQVKNNASSLTEALDNFENCMDTLTECMEGRCII